MTINGRDVPPLVGRDQLVADLEQGSKPQDAWKIGTEHEKFAFHTDDFSPLSYDGPRGVAALLKALCDQYGWLPIMEGEHVIGLQSQGKLSGQISLEPGGQFELSGAPLENVNETCNEVHTHLAQVRSVGEKLGIGFIGLGFSPKWRLNETPQMPKRRYDIMTDYMPKVGAHGLDMMYRSSTVQVNLDFSSESDMVKKLRVSLALQPIATAIFANSPFLEGRPNGFLSYRSEIWRDTDPDRTGLLPFAFEADMSFERYVDYALDVPLYFVIRKGAYLASDGQTFRDFLDGKLRALPKERPTLEDWSTHLTTLFPEVRLKRFLEMRGADGGPWRRLCALPAFWVGLLYDQSALDAAWDLVKNWSKDERQYLRDTVPRHALNTPFRQDTLLAMTREVVKIASEGLKARNKCDTKGKNETQYFETVQQIVEDGKTPAEHLLECFEQDWKGDIDQIFKTHAY